MAKKRERVNKNNITQLKTVIIIKNNLIGF